MSRALYKGSLPPDQHPITGMLVDMNYSFHGYVVVFYGNLGLRHATYLRGCSQDRAMRYAECEAAAVNCTAGVWEAHALPSHKALDWSEEGLPC